MKYLVALVSLGLAACGVDRPSLPPSLLDRQPMVVAMTPTPGSTLDEIGEVVLRFSHPLDPSSVRVETIALVRGIDGDLADDEIVDGWEDRHYPQVVGAIELSSEGEGVRLIPTSALRPEGYAVIVSPAVRSVEGVPLSQTRGSGTTPFVGRFTLREVVTAPAIPVVGSPAIASDGGNMDDSSTASDASHVTASPPQHIIPDEVLINELYYDASGPDTNGVLFVELRGTPGADIGGYRLHCVNGEGGVITESITLPDSAVVPDDGLLVIADGMTGNLQTTQVAEADLVDNFDPQNGPESVQLVDPTGKLIDLIGYGAPLPVYGENGLPMYEGTPGPDAPAGQSVSRLAGAADTDNNASDFVMNTVPSPGSGAVTP